MKWINIPAKVYLIKCLHGDESFYKIGVTTKTVKDRFSRGKDMPYQYRVIQTFETNLYNALVLEKHIKDLFCFSNGYTPKMEMHGYTECFDISVSEDKVIMEMLKQQMLLRDRNKGGKYERIAKQ